MDAGARELNEMGASAEDVERYRAQRRSAIAERDGPASAEVWPDMVAAIDLFTALSTQWRRTLSVGLGGMVHIVEGLRYEAIPAVLAMTGIAPSPGLLRDLRVMEDAALAVLNDRGRG